jgi:hypothetical protein
MLLPEGMLNDEQINLLFEALKKWMHRTGHLYYKLMFLGVFNLPPSGIILTSQV